MEGFGLVPLCIDGIPQAVITLFLPAGAPPRGYGGLPTSYLILFGSSLHCDHGVEPE